MKNAIVAGLAVVFVLALFYQFVYSPAQKTISDSKSKMNDAITAQKTSRAALNAPLPKQTGGGISTDQLNAAVPTQPEVSTLLRQLDALKAKDGMDWSTITPAAPTLAGNLMSINVGITAGGPSYEHARDFVNDVLAIPRFALVDSVSYTQGSVAGGSTSAPTGLASLPSGHIFGSPTGPPPIEVQLTVRVFNGAGTVAAVLGSAGTSGAQTATGAASSTASSASASGH
jgi:Tfp pilus assembly protein PilO